eukprot:6287959-Amphidinium_carterae.1
MSISEAICSGATFCLRQPKSYWPSPCHKRGNSRGSPSHSRGICSSASASNWLEDLVCWRTSDAPTEPVLC